MESVKMRYLFPLGLFIALFLDGSLSLQFSGSMFTQSVSIESRLILLWLVMAICYGNVRHIFVWAVIAGYFFDTYYTGILGLFIVMLPLIVYITRSIMRYFTSSFIVVLLIYLIDITILTVLFYWANALIGFTSVSITTFISKTLGPTLAYNLAIFVILFFPLEQFFKRFS
ncbi:rod shape-determining protein MreD [Ligilactobacillus sp. WILCCON 0076]|uniref:Rod shape-determining protein MreD n=1 Tax=Ligilactobacillus ubinensis TaxID=2876789 RepID=A0A9X2JL34_9LACO|nr:rod shape-determining protein MreD [Ligilactobacillus ubinensis]MCP0886514.1 rod shape-determining protein MreD [Ligilactobacillus ubinensis]